VAAAPLEKQMNLLSRFRRAVPRRTVKDAGPLLGYFIPPDGGPIQAVKAGASPSFGQAMAFSGLAITPDDTGFANAFMASTWAYKCTILRTRGVSRMAWGVYDKQTGDELPNHPLTVALRRSKQNILGKIEFSQVLYGETYLEICYDKHGAAKDIKWLNNLGVEPDTSLGYIRRYNYSPVGAGGGRIVQLHPAQVAMMHTENPHDDLRGLSPYLVILDEIGIDRDVTRVARAFYMNDARPAIVISPDTEMTETDMSRFLDYWKANFQGAKNAGKPAMFNRSIKVIEVQRSPSTEDTAQRESVRREICAGLSVPLSVAGAWDDANYQSAPEQRRSFYEDTIIPQCDLQGEFINSEVLPRFDPERRGEFRYDYSRILALIEDLVEKTNIQNSRLAAGGITLNEYRKRIGEEPHPAGDVLYIPAGVTVVPIDKVAELPPPSAPSFPPLGGGLLQHAPPMVQRPAPRLAPPRRSVEVTEEKGARLNDSEAARPNTEAEVKSPEIAPISEPTTITVQPAPAAPVQQAAYITLSLSEHPQLTAIQEQLRQQYPYITLSDEASLHLTLCYIPNCMVLDKLYEVLPRSINPLPLDLIGFGTFEGDSAEGQPVYLTVNASEQLRALQASIYAAVCQLGCATSEYSTPPAWHPHITLGYMPLGSVLPQGIPVLQVIANKLECYTADGAGFRCLYTSAVKGQSDALAELEAWQKKAINGGWKKALGFVCYHIDAELQNTVRRELSAAYGGPKTSLKAIFKAAKDELEDSATPEEYEKYWGRFDTLANELGYEWLESYMEPTLAVVQGKLSDPMTGPFDPATIPDALAQHHDSLIDSYIGSEEQPGPLVKIMLAGMAAANDALTERRTLNPRAKAVEVALDVNWDLMAKQAFAYARSYLFNLIKNIDATTVEAVQKAVTEWIAAGQPLGELEAKINGIFQDKVRARRIAATEATRAYSEGSARRWQDAGVVKVKFQTVRDTHVCPTCRPLHNQVAALGEGWKSASGTYTRPPMHVNCRCFMKPVVDDA
jgi:HK97 family phage portal protein